MREPDFIEDRGILDPHRRPQHRSDEYDEHGFDVLLRLQREHFWYRGRHELLLKVLAREIRRLPGDARGLRAVDLGGGCGGWVEYLHTHSPDVQ